jgi:hypothetical protein
MHKRISMALFAAFMVVTPSFAAVAKFYVVQSMSTNTCSIVTMKPDGKTAMMVGKSSYKNATSASAALKAAKACKK